jgi:uncharacterized cupin superfamily protein
VDGVALIFQAPQAYVAANMGMFSTQAQESCAALQHRKSLTLLLRKGALAGQGARMSHLIRLSREGITPEISRPDPEKVIEGDPVHTTWNLEERGGLYAGLWHATPGTWRVSYAEWEYVHILEGVSVLTDAEGKETVLQAGDSFVIRPGYSGTWRVVEATLKDYVILA